MTPLRVRAPSLQMVVSDIQAAHDHLKGNGVEVSDIDVQDWGALRLLCGSRRQQVGGAVHPGP
ncbi:UNVERIFIED_ORG: hypothetical protein ABID57_002482 [Arthrobacter sp. UYEF1]